MRNLSSFILLLLLVSCIVAQQQQQSQSQSQQRKRSSSQHNPTVATSGSHTLPNTQPIVTPEPIKVDPIFHPNVPVQQPTVPQPTVPQPTVPQNDPRIVPPRNPFGPSYIPVQGNEQQQFPFFSSQIPQPLFTEVPSRTTSKPIIPTNLQSPCYTSLDCQENVLLVNSDPLSCIINNGASWKLFDSLCINLKSLRSINTQDTPQVPFTISVPQITIRADSFLSSPDSLPFPVFPFENSQHPAINPFPQWASVNPWEQPILRHHPLFVPGLKKQQSEEQLQDINNFQTEPVLVNEDVVIGSSCFSDYGCNGNVISSNINPRSCLTKGGSAWKVSPFSRCMNIRANLRHLEPIRQVFVRTQNEDSSSGLGNYDDDVQDFDDERN